MVMGTGWVGHPGNENARVAPQFNIYMIRLAVSAWQMNGGNGSRCKSSARGERDHVYLIAPG